MKIKFLILLLTFCNVLYAQMNKVDYHSLEKMTYQEMEEKVYNSGIGDAGSKKLQNITLKKPDLRTIIPGLPKHMSCSTLTNLYRSHYNILTVYRPLQRILKKIIILPESIY